MAKKKAIKKNVKPPVAKPQATPEKNTNNPMGSIVIAIVIIAVAVVLGAVTSKLRTAQLQKKAAVNKSITITNPETNKSTDVPINPASVEVTQAKPDNVKEKITDFRYLMKEAESKTAIQKIHITEAKYLFDKNKAVFIDARGESSYNAAHIKGALSMPVNFADQRIQEQAAKFKNKVIVTYCHGVGCHLSDKVAYKLYDAGYKNVLIFFGGWNEWSQAKYPIESSN